MLTHQSPRGPRENPTKNRKVTDGEDHSDSDSERDGGGTRILPLQNVSL